MVRLDFKGKASAGETLLQWVGQQLLQRQLLVCVIHPQKVRASRPASKGLPPRARAPRPPILQFVPFQIVLPRLSPYPLLSSLGSSSPIFFGGALKVLGRTCSETPTTGHSPKSGTEVLAQEFDAFLGDAVVVPVPAEGLSDILLGQEGPENADQVQVGHIQNLVSLQVHVLLG